MLAKTHVAFGILAGLLTLKYASVSNELLFIALVIVGVFLPDVDHSQSKINRSLRVTKLFLFSSNTEVFFIVFLLRF